MAFLPPDFDTFLVNTLNLDAELHTLLGRYKILSSDTEKQYPDSLTKQKTRLKTLISRANQVVNCSSERLVIKEMFTQLVNECRDVLNEGNEEKIIHATSFLLGALVHRYFRIIQEYNDYNSVLFFKVWNVKNCDLFNAIRQALQLGPNSVKGYLIKDLEILDVTTIVQSLEVFQANMLLEDKDRIPRYKKYPHISDESTHFKLYLQNMINEHTQRGLETLKQFKAIMFLQSLAKQVSEEKKKIEDELDNWNNIAKKELSKGSLDLFKLEEHITKHVNNENVRESILDLLHTPQIKDKLSTLNHETFLQEMKLCNVSISSYILFGGYSLVLQMGQITGDLKFAFEKALKIKSIYNDITNQDMLKGIAFIQSFINNCPNLVLNYDFFEGKDKMESAMLNIEKKLTHAISMETNPEPQLSL